ncbi:MAG: hypothetical protein KKB25_01465 [Nanoarchaeota archaeon]|nr:hypothetical protein [Nanoarchaeota archaeon]
MIFLADTSANANEIVNVPYDCFGFLQREAKKVRGENGEKINLPPYAEPTCFCNDCSHKQEIHAMTFEEYRNNGSFIKKCPNTAISRGRKAFYKAQEIFT